MTIAQDVRVALRRLAASPGFTALSLVILALGIGAHVAIFGLADAVLWRALPLPEADRLVVVYESRDGMGFYPLSLLDYADYRDATTVFSSLAAHYAAAPLSLGAGTGQEMITGSVVSPEYFSVLGVEPARGRFFVPEEGTPSGDPVVVISYALWKSRFGGRDDVIGSSVRINGEGLTVVGVAPEGFEGVSLGVASELWIPTSVARVGYRWCEPLDRGCTWLTSLIGRLVPGRSIEDARSEMELLARRIRGDRRAGGGAERGVVVEPLHGLHPSERPTMERLIALLLAAVTLVVVVVGVNLGALLLGRATARGKDAVVRLALGASRWRVASPILAETLLLSIAGGAAGLVVADWLGRLPPLLDPGFAHAEVTIGPGALVYTALVSILTGLAVGLAPGLHASRREPARELRGGGSTGSPGRSKLLGSLVGVQVGLTLVLLVCSGLLVKSSAGAMGTGSADPESVATLRLRPRLVGYGAERAQAVHREVVRRLEALPGVRSVSLGRLVPPWGGVDAGPVARENGASMAGPPEPTSIEVGPRFAETFGFSLLRGRDFDGRDVSGSAPVAIVNQALADARWPEGEALGQLLTIDGRPHEVVGIVGDWSSRTVGQVTPPLAYTPYWQKPDLLDARFGVRVSGDAEGLLLALRRTVEEIDPDLPVTEVATLRDRLERSRGRVRLAGTVIGGSGVLALALSSIGLFAVLGLAVAERAREIGIRVALGGRRSEVVLGVVGSAMRPVTLALALGFAAALLASRALAHYLYGVEPHDPGAYLGALSVLALAVLSASWWAARRATRVDPVEALRMDGTP